MYTTPERGTRNIPDGLVAVLAQVPIIFHKGVIEG